MSSSDGKPGGALSPAERRVLLAPLLSSGWDYSHSSSHFPIHQQSATKAAGASGATESDYLAFHPSELIFRQYTFANFSDAFAFMAQVALVAERVQHHPEWHNVYDRVTVAWRTHDVCGLSAKDAEMATTCDRLYAKFCH